MGSLRYITLFKLVIKKLNKNVYITRDKCYTQINKK